MKLIRTTIYFRRDRMNLTDELILCHDVNILSNRNKLLKVCKLLGFEANSFEEIPNKGWNVADREVEGKLIMISKQIFKLFSEKSHFTHLSRYPNFSRT